MKLGKTILLSLSIITCFAIQLQAQDEKRELVKPTTDPIAGTFQYNLKIDMGQEMEFDMDRTVSFEGEEIKIVDKTATPFGTSESFSLIQKGTLLPLKQEASQGFFSMKLEYTPEKISGELESQGNKTPVDIELKEPVYGSSGAGDMVIANLPLKEGYKGIVRTYIPQQNQVMTFNLSVVAKEAITVMAGEYEAYKLELSSIEDGTVLQELWVPTTGDKVLLKSILTVPQMNGKIIQELSKIKLPNATKEKAEKKKKKNKKNKKKQ